MTKRKFASILITGASSGIGAALALRYAAPSVTLTLTGRNQERLDQVAEAARGRGALVQAAAVSVGDREAMAGTVAAAESLQPLDLVIANAGISGGLGGADQPFEAAMQSRAITETNVEGVLNTVEPALPGLLARGDGQIGLIASLAAFRGFAGAPAYCASKAWVKVWGEGLRASLAPQGVGVTVICPGFVKSRMTAVNDFSMPMIWETDKAATRIVQGLERNRARIAFPWPLLLAVQLMTLLPAGWVDALQRRLPAKGTREKN
ncbi:MAG: SDR family NAD(P)-dependent oxidoreductase [Rhodospirillales bacterium]